jgi:hypothetical protein
MRKTDKKKLAEMTKLIASWKESGLSQRIFCERSVYTMSKFKYWIKKLKQVKSSPNVEQPVSLQIKPPVFLPVEVTTSLSDTIPKASVIEIHYPNGVKVTCESNLDNLKLQTLIQAV